MIKNNLLLLSSCAKLLEARQSLVEDSVKEVVWVMVYSWEVEKIKDWTTNTIKNRIWMAVECGLSVPGCISVEALRTELIYRGEEPVGYHNT